MLDIDPHPAPFRIPEPPQTRFTIEFTADEAKTMQRLAARAGVAPQVVVDKLVRSGHFDAACAMVTAKWHRKCPETGADLPLDMTATANEWLDEVLFSAGLLTGAALEEYHRKAFGDDPKSTFMVALTADETTAVQILARRAKLTPQKLVEALIATGQFNEMRDLANSTFSVVSGYGQPLRHISLVEALEGRDGTQVLYSADLLDPQEREDFLTKRQFAPKD